MYTIVQHSGFGYKENPQFEKGLETREVSRAQQKTVVAAGGLLFPDYVTAEDYAMKEQYRGVEGFDIIPDAPGRFSQRVVDGLRIYVPESN